MGTRRSRRVGSLATAVCLASVLTIVAACGSEKGSSLDGGPPVASTTPFTESAMRAGLGAYLAKLCPAIARCDPTSFAIAWRDVDECMRVGAPIGEIIKYFPYGSTVTPTSFERCADALDFSSCDKLFHHEYELVFRPECRDLLAGTLPQGATCLSNAQCVSGRCFGGLGAAPGSCGTCVERVREGDSCLYYGSCIDGSFCRAQDQGSARCVRSREVGEACDDKTPCHAYLACEAGRCAGPRADASCDPAYGCPGWPLAACNPSTRKCTALVPKQIGDPCGQLTGGGFAYCARGLTCTRRPDVPDSGIVKAAYACEVQREIGQPCNPTDHPYDSPCRQSTCFLERCAVRGPSVCSAPVVPR